MEEVRFGTKALHPHRQLLADGERVPLGRRALRILSLLAEAQGEVVTKEELLTAGWPEATVEENALQAQVVALRKALGSDAHRLETIRGIGYSLNLNGPQGGHSVEHAEGGEAEIRPSIPRPDRAWRVWPIALAGAAAVLVIAASVLFRPGSENSGEVIHVLPVTASGGEQARLLATTLQSDIIDVMSGSGIEIAGTDTGERPADGQLLRGTVTQSGSHLKVHVMLEDAESGTALWSKQIEGPARSADSLATRASAAAALIVYSIGELRLQKGLEIDAASVALHVRGSELVRSAQPLEEGTPRQLAERFVERVPNSAHGHGLLALILISEARRGSHEEREALLSRARAEADKAIAIDAAGAGVAYDARYMMARFENPRALVRIEDLIFEGLRKAPRFAYLSMRECRLLTDTGRASEALVHCQRALALHPYAQPIGHSYARALGAAGKARLAEQAVERAASFDPDHGVTRIVRFEIAAFGGRPDFARRLLADPATVPRDLSDASRVLLDRFLAGWNTWPAAERRALANEFAAMGRSGEMEFGWAVMALAALGDNSQAFSLLRSPAVDQALSVGGSNFLFQPVTRPLRADPRFWDAARDLGLAQYWQARGKWPDMCRDERALARCRAETARALTRHSPAARSPAG